MNEETQQLRAENDGLKESVARRAQSFKGANANEDTTREKLHLKVAPKPNEDNPQPKPQTPAREFLMPDGRPVTIARHCVNFCAKAKEEGRTIVGVKGAVSAMPLMIEYAEFKEWWQTR